MTVTYPYYAVVKNILGLPSVRAYEAPREHDIQVVLDNGIAVYYNDVISFKHRTRTEALDSIKP